MADRHAVRQQHVQRHARGAGLRRFDLRTGREDGSIPDAPDGRTLALTPDGRAVVVGTEVGGVELWGLDPGVRVAAAEVGTQRLGGLAVSADGRWVAAGCEDGAVAVLELPGLREAARLPGHGAGVRGLRFTPDGRHLVTASFDRALRVWDLAGRRCVATFRGEEPVCGLSGFGPAGRFVAGGTGGDLAVLRVRGLPTGTAVVVPTRSWHVDGLAMFDVWGSARGAGRRATPAEVAALVARRRQFREEWQPLFAPGEEIPGTVDPYFTACCPHCGGWVAVSETVVGAARARSGGAAGVPVLDLPSDARTDPRLEFACPHCRGALRGTPFVVEPANARPPSPPPRDGIHHPAYHAHAFLDRVREAAAGIARPAPVEPPPPSIPPPPPAPAPLDEAKRLLAAGHPGEALAALGSARGLPAENARGVCLLRLGRVEEGVELYRGLVVRGVQLRTDVPAEVLANFAAALALARNVVGCEEVLSNLRAAGRDTPQAGRLREQFERSRATESLGGRLRRWVFGGTPELVIDFPLGELFD